MFMKQWLNICLIVVQIFVSNASAFVIPSSLSDKYSIAVFYTDYYTVIESRARIYMHLKSVKYDSNIQGKSG